VAYIVAYSSPGVASRAAFFYINSLQITAILKPKILSVATYDFRTAMKRVGPSVRR